MEPARLRARLASLSLRQLRFFTALAAQANFSRAATTLAVSQPALSGGIRQIEALLQARLFDRTTHRVALTDMGRALLPHVQRLLVTADHAFTDMAEAIRQGGVVRLGAIPSIMPMLARHVAALDRAGDEKVEIHLSDGNSDALLDQLRRGALDLAICAGAVDDPTLRIDQLMEDELLLVVPGGHRFAGAKAVAWKELRGDDVVYFGGGSIGDLASAAMTQNNLAPSRRHRVDQVGSLFGLVWAGLAVGVMPRLYTTGHASGGAVLVPLKRPNVPRRIVLASRLALQAEHPAAATLARRLTAALGMSLAAPSPAWSTTPATPD